jgi:hypothetical protein
MHMRYSHNNTPSRLSVSVFLDMIACTLNTNQLTRHLSTCLYCCVLVYVCASSLDVKWKDLHNERHLQAARTHTAGDLHVL